MNDRRREVPFNVINEGTLLGIDWYRWGEALLSCGAICFIVWSTTFVVRIKVIIIIVVCSVVAFLFLHGIKNRSVTQVLLDIIAETSSRKKYSLGSVANGKNRNKSRQTNQFENLSVFEQLRENIKSKFRQFDEKYGSDEY